MASSTMQTLTIDPQNKQAPTRDFPPGQPIPKGLKPPKQSHVHPTKPSRNGDAKLFFVGTATTILEWEGLTLMTDPNFLHAGDHVHLGPGVTGTRLTDPAIELHELPHIDVVLLSHYHEDHFDRIVEATLRRDLPIITTPHAHEHLTSKTPASESFTHVHALPFWSSLSLSIQPSTTAPSTTTQPQTPTLRITGMPGKHVPDTGILATLNSLVAAVPPTNGWMLELGYTSPSSTPSFTTTGPESSSGTDAFSCGYRIYISGDTLLVDDLKRIPDLYTHAGKPIDLMLVHLGGTSIPSAKLPLVMVTMDAKQGIELVKLIQPDLTIPIHYDDYDVFLSPLEDFQREMRDAGLQDKVVYLDRGDDFAFDVRR